MGACSFGEFFASNSLCWKILMLCHGFSDGYLKFCILLLEFTKPTHAELPFWPHGYLKFCIILLEFTKLTHAE